MDYLTPNQAAEKLAVSPRTIERMLARGLIPAVPVGLGTRRRRWRIRADALANLPPIEPPEEVGPQQPSRLTRRARPRLPRPTIDAFDLVPSL